MPAAMDAFERLFSAMSTLGASDLFICEGRPPSYRIEGTIQKTDEGPLDRETLQNALRRLLRPAQWEEFEQAGDLDVGISLPDLGRFRLNIHLQRGLIAVVARRIPNGNMLFEDLALPDAVREFAELSNGLVLVTGATGSGKSTTLAAILHHINTHFPKHIVTIEDPVEFIHDDHFSIITQREVGSDTRDSKTALRHVLRESPDVLLIGELRDAETVNVALAAALTGHLVISSLHTTDALQTIQRILGFYPEHTHPVVLADLSLCLRGIVAQRLVPRADQTGRIVATEIFTASAATSKLLRENRLDELPEIMSSSPQMCSFNRSLIQLLEQGLITFETGAAFAPNPDEFRMQAQGMERGSVLFASENEALHGLGNLDMRALLHSATRHGASDIHLTAGLPPVFRISGKLRPLQTERLTSGDVRRLLFTLLNASQREQFELEKELDFAVSLTNKVRFRINAHFQRNTAAVSMRLIPSTIPALETLGIPDVVTRLSEAPQGLVLVTGPTGSGKSTTLATLVDIINSTRNCRIITVEDPIEFVHHNRVATIEQREVGADTKSFASALKYILRQDPDVILVGEMRDLETIQAALTAAETGHLVLATLHTNDAPQAIDRILDVFPPFQQEQVRGQIAAALLAVISQRLLSRKDGLGRVAAFEVLLATSAVRAIVREGKTHQLLSAIEIGGREGMQTMDRAVEDLLHAGLISGEEARRYLRKSPSSRSEEPAGAVPTQNASS